MATNIADALINVAEALKTDLIASLHESGRWASGHTAEELQVVKVDESRVVLLGAPWTIHLEIGRGPTAPDAPKGDPTVLEQIQDWVQFKGIPDSAAYAITQKIHKQGYKGKPGVISIPLGDDNVSKRLDAELNNLATLILTETLTFDKK